MPTMHTQPPARHGPTLTLQRLAAAPLLLALSNTTPAQDAPRHYYDDPFLQVTTALPQCAPQEPSKITQAQMQAEAHYRSERGTSCYQSGRCRLPNAYLYDREIIPRVQKALLADGSFADTSIAVEGQRRWVWLKGCVKSAEQSAAAERLVRSIDDVEAVINQLTVLDH